MQTPVRPPGWVEAANRLAKERADKSKAETSAQIAAALAPKIQTLVTQLAYEQQMLGQTQDAQMIAQRKKNIADLTKRIAALSRTT